MNINSNSAIKAAKWFLKEIHDDSLLKAEEAIIKVLKNQFPKKSIIKINTTENEVIYGKIIDIGLYGVHILIDDTKIRVDSFVKTIGFSSINEIVVLKKNKQLFVYILNFL